MKKLIFLLTVTLSFSGCDRAPTAASLASSAVAPSVVDQAECGSVSGTLVLRFAGSDGTHFFFEGDIQGDLQGTLFETLVPDENASFPLVDHVVGNSTWTISGSVLPELIGRALSFSVSGVGVHSDNLGHAFHSTLVGGARSGNIVQQEPQPDFFPYHGEICP